MLASQIGPPCRLFRASRLQPLVPDLVWLSGRFQARGLASARYSGSLEPQSSLPIGSEGLKQLKHCHIRETWLINIVGQ